MAFWSSQTIEANLSRLTDNHDRDMIDCNALTLRLGPEVYVTPGLEHPSPKSHTKQLLVPGAPIAVPPGQFAFLLTEEKVTIPPELMGLISIKATYKLKGLVNVSGFHVDPGWSGRLVFTVFNAGPATIQLERGLPLFLLWIAELDEPSKKRKTQPGAERIHPGMIDNMTGVVDSIYALEKRMRSEVKEISEKQQAFRTEVSELKERQSKILLYFGITAVVAGALLGAAAKLAGDHLFPSSQAAVVEPIPAPEPTSRVVPPEPTITTPNEGVNPDAGGQD